ncbi:MAG: hypothetical protein ACI4L7_02430 [Christensenellales bacterium]
MSTKRKLLFSMLSLVLVILVMGVATFSILSATQQYITANLSLVYNADNVWAEVMGKYSVNGGSFVSLVNSAGGNIVTFDGTEDLSTKTLNNDGANIELSPTAKSVLFIYTFTNRNPSSGGTAMKVTFADTSSSNNLTIKYFGSIGTEPTLAQAKAGSSTPSIELTNIAGQQSGYIAIYLEITSIYSDASYTSSGATAGITSNITSLPSES